MEKDRFPFEKEIKEEKCREQRLDKCNLRIDAEVGRKRRKNSVFISKIKWV